MADERIYPLDRNAPWGQKICKLVGELRYIVNQLGYYNGDRSMFDKLHSAFDVIDTAVTPEPTPPDILKERERIRKILKEELLRLAPLEGAIGRTAIMEAVNRLMNRIDRTEG